jgi:hypothetical protein
VVHFSTTARGSFGSSGSPIFSADGSLVGIADEAGSVSGALLASAVGRQFVVRGVQLPLLHPLLTAPAEEQHQGELSLLLRYYIEEVSRAKGFARARLGSGFITMSDELGTALAQHGASPSLLRPLLAAHTHLRRYSDFGSERPNETALLVAVARSIEEHGLLDESLRLVPRALVQEVLAAVLSPDGAAALKQILGRAAPLGLSHRFLLWGCGLAVFFAALAALWGASFTVVYFRSTGERTARVFKAVLVALVFWPLSFVLWWVKARRVQPLLALTALFSLAACDLITPVPAGRIRFKNDLSGEEYSTIRVSAGGRTTVLKAGAGELLPSGTTDISVSYQGPKALRQYRVQCPRLLTSGITIRLIDIHSNRIAGGCETVWASH